MSDYTNNINQCEDFGRIWPYSPDNNLNNYDPDHESLINRIIHFVSSFICGVHMDGF